MDKEEGMEYTDWIKPRPFQDDPGFIGKVFATQNRESGLEEVICHLATETWINQQMQLGHQLDCSPEAVLDTDELCFGKRKVLYRLRMPDNSLWVARLHNTLYNKTAVTDHTARIKNQMLLFESELATMQFVKENTQIPVPKVYGYDLTYANVLGTPYIFMEYIAGKSYPFPFSGQRPIKDDDLIRIHTQLTNFAWQLSKQPFDKIGQLRFATGEERGVAIGPIVDRKERLYGPFTSSRAFYKERAKTVYEFETRRQKLLGEDSDVEDSLESAALHVLAAEHAGKECFDSGPFILQHADMHWQNLLFDEQCTIVGVIDWEWTQTVPVDSFNLLPWNFASKMLPYRAENAARHEQNSLQQFRALSDLGSTTIERHILEAMISFQGSLPQYIARYMEEYNWPEVRRKHFNHLKELISSIIEPSTSPLVHIIRHGQSLHNIDRGYPHRDPPLTDAGHEATKQIKISAVPDLIVISPMTRTIQTAMNAFPSIGSAPNGTEVQIWPDLREAHDAICNKGISRADISAKYPHLNFAECPEEWDHPPHTIEAATIRAETVRGRLKELSKVYNNIVLITHRGFIAFLVQGDRYDICETRSYRFGTDEETEADSLRFGVNVDTKAQQDFGPTVLVPHPPQGSSNA